MDEKDIKTINIKGENLILISRKAKKIYFLCTRILSTRWNAVLLLIPKIFKIRVDLRHGGVVMQCLTYATIMPGDAAEVAVLVDHSIMIAPFMVFEITLIVAVQIPNIVSERIRVREIVHVEEGMRWQQS